MEAIVHRQDQLVRYSEYGNGKELMLAFHGYGMDGFQFEVLPKSITQQYRVIGFHLPNYKRGDTRYLQWLEQLHMVIPKVLEGHKTTRFSLIGYSIGAKISLYTFQQFAAQVNQIYLMAPYGLEKHKGLDFVTGKFGNGLFKVIVKSSLPGWIMKAGKVTGFVKEDLYDIISKELATTPQRESLCHTLAMVGQIRLDRRVIVDLLNTNKIQVKVYYGRKDGLFPYDKRKKVLLETIHSCQSIPVEAGHWMVTQELDELMAS